MDRLPVYVYDHEFADVVLGPCPGCWNWQLDYTYEAAGTYFGDKRAVDTSGFHLVVEGVLAEHLDECPELRDLIEVGF